MGQVATSFDDGYTTNAFGSATKRLLARDEECKLQLVVCVQSVQPWEDLLRRWERLGGDVIESLYQSSSGDIIQYWLFAQFLVCRRRMQERGGLEELCGGWWGSWWGIELAWRRLGAWRAVWDVFVWNGRERASL